MKISCALLAALLFNKNWFTQDVDIFCTILTVIRFQYCKKEMLLEDTANVCFSGFHVSMISFLVIKHLGSKDVPVDEYMSYLMCICAA